MRTFHSWHGFVLDCRLVFALELKIQPQYQDKLCYFFDANLFVSIDVNVGIPFGSCKRSLSLVMITSASSEQKK